MKRTLPEFIYFFINDENEYGEIARKVQSDPNFPRSASTQDVQEYLQRSPDYAIHKMRIDQICSNYRFFTSQKPDK